MNGGKATESFFVVHDLGTIRVAEGNILVFVKSIFVKAYSFELRP